MSFNSFSLLQKYIQKTEKKGGKSYKEGGFSLFGMFSNKKGDRSHPNGYKKLNLNLQNTLLLI
jgi:hypothetical protein